MLAMRAMVFLAGIILLAGPAAAGHGLLDDMQRTDPNAESQPGSSAGSGSPSWMRMIDAQQVARAESEADRDGAATNAESGSRSGESDAGTRQERWSDFLPLWGKELRADGYDIPPPFGVSLLTMYTRQDVEQTNFKTNFGRDDPLIDTGLVQFSDGDTKDIVFGSRIDAFILPFFDVYFIGGVNTGETEFQLDIDPNFVLPDGASETLKEDYVGGFVGGGATVALGWRELFWMADGNYTWARADAVDSTIEAATFSTRLGWRRSFDKFAVSLWAGTMFMHLTQTIDFSVDLLVTEIVMEMDIKSSDPWNMLLGGTLDIGENWQIMVEGGFIGRSQATAMVAFRF
jgi:hypothetical protein